MPWQPGNNSSVTSTPLGRATGSSSAPVLHLGFARRWSPFKRLMRLITSVVVEKSDHSSADLDDALRAHKSDFIALLRNPGPSTIHKETVLQASTSGIAIDVNEEKQHNYQRDHGHRSKTILGQEMIDEALLMSRMFDLNELAALELIVAGENHESRYPGLSRGPVAVLLYLDGRRSLVQSLELLTQAYSGRSWSLNINSESARVVSQFIDELRQDNIIQTVIDQLAGMDVERDFDMLQKNRALGPAKYRKQVYDIIVETRQSLANITFNLAAQSCLSELELDRLLQILANGSLTDEELDPVSLALLSAVLYTIDLSPLQNCDENMTTLPTLPLIRERSIFIKLIDMLQRYNFNVPQVKTAIQLAWCLAVKTALMFPFVNGLEQFVSELDEDRVLDEIIDNQNLFDSLNLLFAHGPLDEFHARRVHTLMVDMITLLPLKMKEIRDQGDETARIVQAYLHEGLQPPPNLPRHFEQFLLLLSDFYSHDQNNLSRDFFIGDRATSQKNVALNKFLRSLQDSYLPTVLHIPVLKLFNSLAKSNPFNVFNLIKSLGDADRNVGYLSLSNFFTCLNQYFLSVRGGHGGQVNNPNVSRASISTDRSYFGTSSVTAHYPISQIELDTFVSILELIESIVSRDKACSMAIAENHQYGAVQVLVGLLMCAVPRLLKASILTTLAGMSTLCPNVAMQIWPKLDILLPRPPVHASSLGINPLLSANIPKTWQHGLAIELDDIEPRQEDYPMTIGLLRLLSSLFVHIDCKENSEQLQTISSCLDFVISYVLLKVHSRAYKEKSQKWEILKYGHLILSRVLSNYDGKSSDKLGFSLMVQILQDQGLFRTMLDTLEEMAGALEKQLILTDRQPTAGEQDSDSDSKSLINTMSETACEVLKVLNLVSDRESNFIELLHTIQGYPLSYIVRLDVLFDSINPRTSQIDRLATLIRLIASTSGIVQYESLQIAIVSLLSSLMEENREIPIKILVQVNAVPNSPYVKDEYLIYHFVEFLESPNRKLRIATLELLSRGLNFSTSLYGCGLCHKLFGFNLPGRMIMREPLKGFGQVYNCLHAMLSILLSDNFRSPASVEFPRNERVIAMEILYKLSCDSLLSDTVLRYLRTSSDLFPSYLNNFVSPLDTSSRSTLEEMKYFLRILSLEVASTVAKSLRSHSDTYVGMLFSQPQKRFLKLLPVELFSQDVPDMPQWEFFDPSELMKMISDCTDNARIDEKRIRERLVDEVQVIGSHIGISQGRLIEKEIQQVSQYVSLMNDAQGTLEDKSSYFESFRDLIEIMITSGAFQCLPPELRHRISFELIHFMLDRITNEDELITRMLTPLSTLILTLAAHLHSLSNEVSSSGNSLMPAVETRHRMSDYVTTCRSIIRTLEYSNFVWSTNHNRTRINLIGSLLYFLQSMRDAPGAGEVMRLSARLVERLFRGLMSGHDVLKVCSISVLLSVPEMTWLKSLSEDGTLRMILESLLDDDRDIRMEKCATFSRAFFSIETKLALLSKIASTSTGARILLHSDMINIIASIQSFGLVTSQKRVPLRVFNAVMRSVVTMNSTLGLVAHDELGQFLYAKQEVLCELLLNCSALNETVDGQESVKLTVSFLSRFTPLLSESLQSAMMACLKFYINNLSTVQGRLDLQAQTLSHLLLGLINLMKSPVMAEAGVCCLFSPSLTLDYDEPMTVSRANFSAPPLGLLVLAIMKSLDLINQQQQQQRPLNAETNDEQLSSVIESSVYLLWCHLSFYLARSSGVSYSHLGMGDEIGISKRERETLKLEIPGVITDPFLGRILALGNTQENVFIQSIVRRLQRIVQLKL